MKKFATVLILVAAILVGGMTMDAKTAKKKSKARTTKPKVTKTPEEIEKEKAFTSPDLDFFNLHGPVKSVSIKATKMIDPVSQYGYKDGTYTFDAKGNWLNYKKHYVTELKRNNAGQIIAVIMEDDEYDYLSACDYTWEDNEITDYEFYNTNYSDYGDEPLYSGTYEYSNGVLTNEEGWYTARETVPYEITFSNFVFDNYGNWTSCVFHCTMPDPYTDQGGTLNSSGTIKRTIKYF